MNLQACFVNTEEKPIAVKRLKIFQYQEDLNGKLGFIEWCEYIYPHPDAPEHAIIKIKVPEEVKCPLNFEKTAKLVIDSMYGLAEVLR